MICSLSTLECFMMCIFSNVLILKIIHSNDYYLEKSRTIFRYPFVIVQLGGLMSDLVCVNSLFSQTSSLVVETMRPYIWYLYGVITSLIIVLWYVKMTKLKRRLCHDDMDFNKKYSYGAGMV